MLICTALERREMTEQIDWREKATLTSDLLLGRFEVLRSLRRYLQAQSQGHHTIDRLEERGLERGSARWSSLERRERAIVNQTNIGIVLKATLGKLLRDEIERIYIYGLFGAHRYHLELNYANVLGTVTFVWCLCTMHWFFDLFFCGGVGGGCWCTRYTHEFSK